MLVSVFSIEWLQLIAIALEAAITSEADGDRLIERVLTVRVAE